MNTDNPLRLASPNDLVTTLPYLLGGEPPGSGLVILAMRGRAVHCIARRELDPTGTDVFISSAEPLARWAVSEDCDGLIIVGYGSGDTVTAPIDAIRAAATAHEVRVLEALRVHQGRYWSYVCDTPGCCPPEGTKLDSARATAPAEAVLRGLAPHAPQTCSPAQRAATSRQRLEPDPSVPPQTVVEATRAAESEAERLDDCGMALVREAIEAERTGTGPHDVGALIRLAVVLRDLQVRDTAWLAMTVETARTDLELWARITRAAQPSDRAAPAALTAVAAWLGRDLPMARVALDVALAADPNYTMARLVTMALDAGLPAHKWTESVRNRGEEDTGSPG